MDLLLTPLRVFDHQFAKRLMPVFGLIGVFIVYAVATPYMTLATVAYALLCIGLTYRGRDNLKHAKFMASGIGLDLAIVLALEFQRSAINTAVEMTLTPAQQAHIGFSTIALVLYFPVFFIGFKRLKGKASANGVKWHRWLGGLAFIFRTLGFILMFTLLEHYLNK